MFMFFLLLEYIRGNFYITYRTNSDITSTFTNVGYVKSEYYLSLFYMF